MKMRSSGGRTRRRASSFLAGLVLGFLAILLHRLLRSTTTTVVVTKADLDRVNQKCERLLDRFDGAFDERRDARNERVASFVAKKTTQLDEWNKKERLRKAAAKVGNKSIKKLKRIPAYKLWWVYDVEAGCHTNYRDYIETRFPKLSNGLYDAFYEGPKFLCGIDLMSTLPPEGGRALSKRKPCLAYKVGASTKDYLPLDLTISNFLGCETHVFDPDLVDRRTQTDRSWHHHGEYALNESLFGKAILKLGHHGRTVDVIRLDCGGCEWDTLPPLLERIARGTLTVHQIHVEFHDKRWDGDGDGDVGGGSNPHVREIFRLMDDAGMRIVEKEPNFGERTYEYVWVHRSFLRNANRKSLCA